VRIVLQHRTDGDADLLGTLPDAIVEERDIAVPQALEIGNRLHASGADIGMDLERHPVFREIELRPDLVENSLSDIAERSVEVVEYEQFANHVFPLCDGSFVSSGAQAARPMHLFG
jgi:hypothetical protein